MKVIIPTYKRLHTQVTYDNLHDKSNVWLAVREEEAEEASKISPNIFVLDSHVSNFPETVENICKRHKGERIVISDDDLKFGKIFKKEGSEWAKWTSGLANAEEEHAMWARINKYIDDGYAHGGFWIAGLAPKYYDDMINEHTNVNARYNNMKWYDLSAFDPDDIDWTTCVATEDYYVALQLIQKGFPSAVDRYYALSPKASHSAGGCSTYRTVEVHNESQRKLAEIYPEFVSLNKPNKNGYVTLRIDFKKAYKNWEDKKPGALEEFFV